MDDADQIPVRLRAARQLAGHKDPSKLAAALAGITNGLGTTNLRKIEQGKRVPNFTELRAIAEACGLPVEWFTADLARLSEISIDAQSEIARLSAALKQRLEDAAAENGNGQQTVEIPPPLRAPPQTKSQASRPSRRSA